MTASGRSVPGDAERVQLDINAIAISLVENHPGHDFVRPAVDAGLDGAFEVLVVDAHPLRAQYVLTTDFEVDRVAARNSIQSLLRQPVRVVGASKETILDAYSMSAEQNHDVYDCFLLAVARHHGADCLLTTDTDFERLCSDGPITYVNPVPPAVLERFAGI